MLRRDFMSVLAGAVVAGSRFANAQTRSKVYKIGTLLPGAPLDEKSPADYGADVKPRLKVIKTEERSGRKAGVKVKSVAELIDKLKNEAGVL